MSIGFSLTNLTISGGQTANNPLTLSTITAKQGDLLVGLVYAFGNDVIPIKKDDSENWIVGDCGFDLSESTFNGAIYLAICNKSLTSQSSSIPMNKNYSGMSAKRTGGISILPTGFSFDLSKVSLSSGWFHAVSAGTAHTAPSIIQPYSQCVDIIWRASVSTATTAIPAISGWSLLLSGNIGGATPYEFRAEYRIVMGYGDNSAVSSNAIRNCTKRMGFRVMIPIIGNVTPQYRRYLSSRRIG